MAEIREFGKLSQSPISECSTPDPSFSNALVSCDGAYSSSSSGGSNSESVPISISSGNNLSQVESAVSSSCSSLSTYSKPVLLHSICEVDHSGNNNSLSKSSVSSPDLDQKIIAQTSINSRALSASPL